MRTTTLQNGLLNRSEMKNVLGGIKNRLCPECYYDAPGDATVCASWPCSIQIGPINDDPIPVDPVLPPAV